MTGPQPPEMQRPEMQRPETRPPEVQPRLLLAAYGQELATCVDNKIYLLALIQQQAEVIQQQALRIAELERQVAAQAP